MSKINVECVFQSEFSECGLACVSMILSAHEKHKSLNELRYVYGSFSDGMSLDMICTILNEHNMLTRALKLDIEAIKYLNTPAILHWGTNHFVILKQYKNGVYTILDPGRGELNVGIKELDECFTGIALEAYKDQSFLSEKKSKSITLFSIFSNVTGLKNGLGKILIISLLYQIYVVASPIFTQIIVDSVITTSDISLLNVITLSLTFLLIFQVSTFFIRSKMIMHVNTEFNTHFSSSVYNHLLSLPARFFSSRDVADIISKFDSTSRIREFFTVGLIESIIDIALVIMLSIVMYFYSHIAFFICLLSSITYMIFKYYFMGILKNATNRELIERASERNYFIETIKNVKYLSATGTKDVHLSQWFNRFLKTINSQNEVIRVKIYLTSIGIIVFGAENLINLNVISREVISNDMTLGALIAFLSMKIMFTQKTILLIDKYFEYKLMAVHIERLSDILLEPKELASDSNRPLDDYSIINLNGISFKHDYFSAHLFKNVNLQIENGQFICLMGKSGVGKSTLIDIILGIVKPSSGTVTIDGIDLSEYGYSSLRSITSVIFQDDNLFPGTIAQNITNFSNQIEHSLLIDSMRLTGVDRIVEKRNMGVNTYITSDGGNFSKGEKQRILLARALYRQPKLIICDESTSNLDVANENIIIDTLRSINITKIVISHRPQTIRAADVVYKLTNDGAYVIDDFGKPR